MITRNVSFGDIQSTSAARVFCGGMHYSVSTNEDPLKYVHNELIALIGQPLSRIYSMLSPDMQDATIINAIAVNTSIQRFTATTYDVYLDLYCYYEIKQPSKVKD